MQHDSGARGAPRRIAVAADKVVDFLTGTSLFRGCDRQTIEKIAPHVFAADVSEGTVIVRANTPDPGIGFVFRGRAVVRMVDPLTHKPVVIEEVGIGEVFGDTGAFA